MTFRHYNSGFYSEFPLGIKIFMGVFLTPFVLVGIFLILLIFNLIPSMQIPSTVRIFLIFFALIWNSIVSLFIYLIFFRSQREPKTNVTHFPTEYETEETKHYNYDDTQKEEQFQQNFSPNQYSDVSYEMEMKLNPSSEKDYLNRPNNNKYCSICLGITGIIIIIIILVNTSF